MRNKLRAYIFDFDGVVVDSMSLHLKAWQKAHNELFGCDYKESESYSGMASTKIAAKMCSLQNDPGKAERLVDIKRSIMREIYPTVELLPGAKKMFRSLRSQGIPFGICSNATREFIEKILEIQGLDADTIVSIESTPTPKPHPAPYLLAAKNLGVSEAEYRNIAAFEDSKHGMRAIKSAGFYGVGILSLQKKEDLESCGAKKTFKNLEEALKDPELFGLLNRSV